MRDPFPPAIRLIEKGVIDLKPLVTHVVPFADYPEFMQGVTGGSLPARLWGRVMTRGLAGVPAKPLPRGGVQVAEGGEGFYAAYFRDLDGNKLDVFNYS